MKGRESGMPDDDYWQTFFDPACVIRRLFRAEDAYGDVVEFGCGYGTFTLAAARQSTGTVSTFDIEPEMVSTVQRKAEEAGLSNVVAAHRDFVDAGTGLADNSQRHAMIYNLLHLENPVALLREAHRVLEPQGRVSIIHWRSDIPTPRGPSMNIRPPPERCIGWMEEAGFRGPQLVDLEECCPYHFGVVALAD